MEPPSAPAHRGHVPWHRLLLAVSLLSFWNLPATAQITIESVPFNVAEGSDVLLLAHNATEDTLGYSWYRGERVENNQLIVTYRIDTQAYTQGPTFSGRERIYPNGSLLFQNATQNDTGYYTLMVTKNDLQREIVTGLLRVYPVLPRPIITSNNPNPVEHEDTVVLTCEPETQHTTYRWWINNQSLSNSTRLQLSEDNRTLTLFNVTRNDTGPYECETQNPVSATRSDPFTLNVIHPVAKPIIEANSTTVTEHEDTVVLKCLTNDTGVSLRWLFNGQSLLLAERIKLSQDNGTLTIEPVRREDAGNYQCEASNLGNSNKSDPLRLDVKFDSAPGSSSGLSGGAIAGIVIGVLAGVALIAGLVYFLFIRKIGGASDQRQLTENKSSDFNHIQDHSDKLSKKESKKPTSALPSPSATEMIHSEVKKKKE
uniref:Ig-like domain-containing protein n=1 Tax=Sus scrofa TaxID=9823 RepID=A0A4X1SJT7_PIG